MDLLERARDTLPRDVFLKIIGYFDMETRIRFDLVRKLRVPDDVRQRLVNIAQPTNTQGSSFVWLGPIMYFRYDGLRHRYSKYKIYKYPSENSVYMDVFHSFIKDGSLIKNFLRYTLPSTHPTLRRDSRVEIDRE